MNCIGDAKSFVLGVKWIVLSGTKLFEFEVAIQLY